MTTQAPAVDQSTTGKHLPALDGIRGLAILLVLIVHLFVHNPRPDVSMPLRIVAVLFSSGWVGVDLFFVLSGFLITGILYDTQRSRHFFRNFYARRALRIFPLYYAFLGMLILISTIQGYHWYAFGTFLFLSYLHTLHVGGVAYTTAPWVNINHLWSLAIEEQFYMVWPITVSLLATKRRIVTAALLLTAMSFGLRGYFFAHGTLHTYPFLTYSFTPARLDGLLLGAVLAMLVRSRHRGTILRWAPAIFFATMVVVLTLLFGLQVPDPMRDTTMGTTGYPLLSVLFAALIASTLRAGSLFSRAFSNGILRSFGRYSYGLYVYHFLIAQLTEARLHFLVERATGSKLAGIFIPGALVVFTSYAVAALSFHFFEQPILRLKRYFADTGNSPKLRHDVEEASEQAEI